MTPHREDPELAPECNGKESPRAICAWCIYRGESKEYIWDRCLLEYGGMHPQIGFRRQNLNGKMGEPSYEKNKFGRCEDFCPTFWTRIFPWRQNWLRKK